MPEHILPINLSNRDLQTLKLQSAIMKEKINVLVWYMIVWQNGFHDDESLES